MIFLHEAVGAKTLPAIESVLRVVQVVQHDRPVKQVPVDAGICGVKRGRDFQLLNRVPASADATENPCVKQANPRGIGTLLK